MVPAQLPGWLHWQFRDGSVVFWFQPEEQLQTSNNTKQNIKSSAEISKKVFTEKTVGVSILLVLAVYTVLDANL